MMMVRDKKDINPLLLKFGVALALSFAGFLSSPRLLALLLPQD